MTTAYFYTLQFYTVQCFGTTMPGLASVTERWYSVPQIGTWRR